MLKISNPEVKSLLRDVMAHGNHLQGRAVGRSMYHLVHPNDLVFIEYKSIEDLDIGDIIFFRSNLGSYITHRLIKKIGKVEIITRGDNVPRFDHPVPSDSVVGRVIQIESHGKRLKLTGRPSRIFAYCIACFSRVRFPGQVRINRVFGRIYWFFGGRNIS